MKAGYKTTEFWMTLAGVLLSFLISQGIVTGEQIDNIFVVLAPVIGSTGYSIARGLAKQTRPEADS